MIKILFVCHGNICRSTMAQFVFQDIVNKAGLARRFYIDSAATSTEEIGNPPHYGTVRKMREVGIPVLPHKAVQMRRADYEKYDFLLGMDEWNIRNMLRICGEDPQHKICRLLDFTDHPRDIADMVLYLCSDKAGFITGENICIDGGMTRQMIYHGEYGWTLEKE